MERVIELTNDRRILLGDARDRAVERLCDQDYNVILADPPYKYNFYVAGRRSIKSHYAEMTDDELKAMRVSELGTQKTVLLMWSPMSVLERALAIQNAWGFSFATAIPWIKLTKAGQSVSYGTGQWARACSELLLICRRKETVCPKSNMLGLLSPNMYHSRKPVDVYSYAQENSGPYLELFARRTHDGWDSFGNEVEDLETGRIYKFEEAVK